MTSAQQREQVVKAMTRPRHFVPAQPDRLTKRDAIRAALMVAASALFIAALAWVAK